MPIISAITVCSIAENDIEQIIKSAIEKGDKFEHTVIDGVIYR